MLGIPEFMPFMPNIRLKDEFKFQWSLHVFNKNEKYSLLSTKFIEYIWPYSAIRRYQTFDLIWNKYLFLSEELPQLHK